MAALVSHGLPATTFNIKRSMTESKSRLPPAILKYCQHCSRAEQKAIVAYCCYMAFRDRSVRRQEIELVESIADVMNISSLRIAKLTRKARRRRLKIMKPESNAARKLLFHLALRMAAVDTNINSRERSAIDKLAEQLRIKPDSVERELQKLLQETETLAAAEPQREKQAEELAGAIESLEQDWVVEMLEADLFSHPQHSGETRQGELEYTKTQSGEAALNIELEAIDTLVNQSVSIFIAGTNVCQLTMTDQRVDRMCSPADDIIIPQVSSGDVAEIRFQDKAVLKGTFDRK